MTVKLHLPQLNSLSQAHFQRNRSQAQPSQQQQTLIPSWRVTLRSVTRQITNHWQPYKKLQKTRHMEQLQLHMPPKLVATEDTSTLRHEMRALEPTEDDAKPRHLVWKPLGWLGHIRPVGLTDSCQSGLWQIIFCSTIGAGLPGLAARGQHATGGCHKFIVDPHGDHISTCNSE